MVRTTRNLGLLLLAIYLILVGLSLLIGLHFIFFPQIQGLLALIAGILILLGR